MKKITEGCLAIVTGGAGIGPTGKPVNVGKVLTIGKFIGRHPKIYGKNLWEVNQYILFMDGTKDKIINEKYLERIDDESKDEKFKEKILISDKV